MARTKIKHKTNILHNAKLIILLTLYVLLESLKISCKKL